MAAEYCLQETAQSVLLRCKTVCFLRDCLLDFLFFKPVSMYAFLYIIFVFVFRLSCNK